MIYSTSLACGNVLGLESDVEKLLALGQTFFHIDIMDGHFVPNLCFSPDVVRALHARFDCVLDVHLMVSEAQPYLARLAEAGADMITIHAATVNNAESALQEIHSYGIKAGLALSPKEKAASVLPYADLLDLVLIMSVQPGFSGQSFLPEQLAVLEGAAEMRKKHGFSYKISVDGGLDDSKTQLCRAHGADILVMGAKSFYVNGVLDEAQVKRFAAL